VPRGLPSPSEIDARRAQMFPALSPEQLARASSSGVEQTIEAGTIAFDQGDRDTPFYVLLEGELEVVHPNGKGTLEEPITIHKPNEFTGEINLLTDRRALVRGRAKGRLRASNTRGCAR